MKQWLGVLLLCGLLWACAGPSRSSFRPPPPPPQVWTQECSGLRVQLTVERKPPSPSTYAVHVTDLSGQPLAEASRVVLVFTSEKDNSTTTLVAQPLGAGHYAPTSIFTAPAGPWKVEAIVRRVNTPEVTCVFQLNL